MSRLHILLVEDDQENLELLKALLPTTINGEELTWHPCVSFEDAFDKLGRQRYDMVVTDVYRDRKGENKHHLNVNDAAGTSMLDMIRAVRFCPIVFFSDGSQPDNLVTGPFIRFVDKIKTEQLINEITSILATGIPSLAAKLHEELDRSAGSYLWTFLEEQWERLAPKHNTAAVLERLIRRRAAVQLGQLNPTAPIPTELAVVEGAEFYLYPSIAGDDYRLGDILQHGEEFRVILTPHCYLTTQAKATAPRAEHIVTVRTVPAADLISKYPIAAKTDQKKDDAVRRYINSPAEIGALQGRYWFLPGFLAIPDLFCDLLQLESIPLATIKAEHNRIATLDSPFSEALQACYLKFYTAVGLPSLQPERFAIFKTIAAIPAKPIDQPPPPTAVQSITAGIMQIGEGETILQVPALPAVPATEMTRHLAPTSTAAEAAPSTTSVADPPRSHNRP